ncbi:MAG TPA: J domain-containing protein [Candidatus Limnocylindrales bacterium]
MTANADPWKTLGLAPGAGIEEIRRAYRRLAKVNHPDAAGESALPRFLAIQAAYEQLVAPGARRRPGSRPARPTTTPPEPWQADPDRARASGRADGRRPGARPTGRSGAGSGATGSGTGNGKGQAGTSTGTADGAGSAAGPDGAAGAGAGASSRSRRPSGRRRAPNKATPYSTSYDPGDEEPFEPGWSGASWYGSSSGTYWTINPKEYADPRKHGPEYQRRARRGANGWIVDDVGPAGAEDAEPERPEPAAEPPPSEATWTDAAAGARPEHRQAAAEAGIGGESTSQAGAATSATGEEPPPPIAHRPNPRDWFEPPPPDRRFRGPVLRRPTSGLGRVSMALLAWPPLALVTTVAIGEETGCGRFAASCGEVSSPGTWIVLAAIFLLLLALPRVAAWLAHGTLATALIGIPTAIVLSAGGGSRVPEASAAFLTTVLAIAWVAGVAYGLIVPHLGGSSAPSAARR